MTFDGQRWLRAARGEEPPSPQRERWQPLRAGVYDLWEYDDAEFWFADGRAVLRGSNGTGKTKVLELTTLMLLRGEIRPEVLDPFGSQHRTMAYNILPSGEDDDHRALSDSGLGYAWLELGHLDPGGAARYLTLGLGASARRGSGNVSMDRWLFVTERRLRTDLVLRPPAGCLTEKELRQQPRVWVTKNAAEYRATVARDLYGVSPETYQNLTDLLKQLRRPKLGERLNPGSLASTLSDALPPLAQSEVMQLAEGWDRLNALQQAIEQLEGAAIEVATFSRQHWLPWAQTVVGRRALEMRQARTELDNTTRARREAEVTLTALQGEVQRTEQRQKKNTVQWRDVQTQVKILLQSAAYQTAASAAQQLENLRSRAAQAETQVWVVQTAHGRATKRAEDAEREHAEALEAHRQREAACAERARAVEQRAGAAGLTGPTRAHLPEPRFEALLVAHQRRQGHLSEMRRLVGLWQQVQARLDTCAERLEDAERSLDQARARAEQAERDAGREADDLLRRLRTWALRLEVAVVDEAQLSDWIEIVTDLAVVVAEGEPPDRGQNPLSEGISAHLETRRRQLQRERESLLGKRTPLADRQQSLSDDLHKVRSAEEAPPPAPALWARRPRPDVGEGAGAPFWGCVQPREEVAADRLAMIEAALAAAGVLDAWLLPDGSVRGPDGREVSDTFLDRQHETGGATLEAVLEPTPVGGIGGDRIGAVLRGIGWFPIRPAADGRPRAWIAGDGRWQVGPLDGRAEPAGPASYLGATAREQARLRRIEALEERLAAIGQDIDEIDADIAGNRVRLSSLDAEGHAAPNERRLLQTLTTADALIASRRDAEARRDEVGEQHRGAEEARDRARAEMSTFAGDHSFPLEGLDAVSGALVDYRLALDALFAEWNRLQDRARDLKRADDQWRQARQDEEDEGKALSLAKAERRDLEVAVGVAEATLGEDARAQLDRRDELTKRGGELEKEAEDLQERHTEQIVKRTGAEDTLNKHEEARSAAERRRNAAMERWWAADDAGLFVGVGLEPSATRNVETARESASGALRHLPSVPSEEQDEERAWRHCLTYTERLRQSLLPERDAQAREPESALQPARVEVQIDAMAGWLAPPEAADTLAGQVQEQRTRYDAEQQRVLLTLLGSTFIEHLKDRLDYAAAVFHRINQRLARHPTNQGHTIRLDWTPHEGDPYAAQVVDALRQGYEHLSDQRQQQVRDFLAHRIDLARDEARAAGIGEWSDHLAAALDYRKWLRIKVMFRPGTHGQWRPFDIKRHEEKSGGERVVLLSQPLFAAAVVAYDSAGPSAPRMVWLDEAMTGVDEGAKASFMGLTVEFDLDLMVTAHDEWCTYPSVPAAAIYDLARSRAVPGVDALVFLWCGGELTEVEVGQRDTSDGGQVDVGPLFAIGPGE